MTEEEFIRAIVASPGDDTPRLAYADWLDDHDAARAAYLRAEAAWAALRLTCLRPSEAALWDAAARLDPLWVARVSRPPLGVCCDHFVMEDAGPGLDQADLARVEAEFGFQFPVGYAAFLLNHNGGRPCPTGTGLARSGTDPDSLPDFFFPVGVAGDRTAGVLQREITEYRTVRLPRFLTMVAESDDHLVEWFENCIPIGWPEAPDFARLLTVSGRQRGMVSWIDWTVGPVGVEGRGPTLPEFLASYRPSVRLALPNETQTPPHPGDDSSPPALNESDIPW